MTQGSTKDSGPQGQGANSQNPSAKPTERSPTEEEGGQNEKVGGESESTSGSEAEESSDSDDDRVSGSTGDENSERGNSNEDESGDSGSDESGSSSAIDDDDEDEEEEEEPQQLLPKVIPRRTTRGIRMTELSGELLEADEEFWGQDAWNVDDNDIAYETEEEVRDKYDSDFFEDESTDDEVLDKEGVEKQRSVEKAQTKKKSVYKEPYKPPVQRVRAAGRPRVQPQKRAADLIPVSRTLRTSTENKSAMSMESRKKEKKRKPSSHQRKRAREEDRLTQSQLIVEAVETEIQNQRSLKDLQRIEEEKRAQAPPKKRQIIRTHSKKGEQNTITFIDFASLPPYINSSPVKAPKKPLCAITGLPAKFRDPLTKKFYANLDSFKKLRQNFAAARTGRTVAASQSKSKKKP